ncbi:MAG TPA: MFS transporter [Tepidisphaeraceae bacterium]|nr:MFS transporter [Tepidisphaeraceae bacterium]
MVDQSNPRDFSSPLLNDSAYDPTRAAARFARVIPLAFITYGLAYFDRVNYGYGVAGGLAKTIGMSESTSPLLAALFFIGYMAFQIPGAGYAARYSAKKLVFWALVLWGGLCAAQGLVHSVWMLALVRTLLGAVESVVFPAMLVFLTHWFTKRERSRANTLLILGNPITMTTVSVISGFLIDYFDRHRVFGLQGWQTMFVLEGLPSIIWACIWWFTADDWPNEARWLGPGESAAIEEKLQVEQQEIPPIRNYWAAFRDQRVILMSVMYFWWSIGTYGFVFWLPKILKDAEGLTNSQTGLLAAIPYFLAIFTMLIVSYWSDRLLLRKIFIWPAMVIGGIAFLVAWQTAASHFWIAFAALAFAGASVYTPCGPLWALIAEMVPRNVVGESMALVNSAGALGGFVGALMVGWLIAHFHSDGAGFLFLAGSLIAAGLITIGVKPARTAVAARGFPVEPRPTATDTATIDSPV